MCLIEMIVGTIPRAEVPNLKGPSKEGSWKLPATHSRQDQCVAEPYLTIVDPQRSSRTIRRISSFGIDFKSVILLHCIGLLHLVLFLVIRFSSRQNCSSIVLCLP